MKNKALVIDLDGTLCSQESYDFYGNAVPNLDVINRCRDYYLSGWHVTIHTARGMMTHNGNVKLIEENLRDLTEKWLIDNGVLYNELVFGKPPGNYYVDDKMLSIGDFVFGSKIGEPYVKNLQKIVFTNGCFDLLHYGHIENLKYAKSRAGKDGLLVVGLNSDESIKRIKGVDRPFQDLKTRVSVLENLKFVDKVIVFNEDTPANLIKVLKPSIIVKGLDYADKQVVGQEFGITVEYAPFVEGYSTTKTLERIK